MNDSNSNASGVFINHIKQVITTLPPVTKLSLFIPFILLFVDIITSSVLHVFSLSYWTFLDGDLVLYSLQIQRIFLYPFSSKSFVEVLITAFWLFPEIYKAEKKMGSIRLLWTLFSLFTIPPAIVYIFVTQILRRYTPEVTFASISYFGMAGWVVGLVIANYLKYDTNDDNQRMIAGAIQIPNKVWPAIVLLFFVILAPGSSFILNLSSACSAILYGQDKLPNFFNPSDETIALYEEKSWLSPLTGLPNFVSSDCSGVYLPIFHNPSRFASTENSEAPTTSSPNNAPNFPGAGIRLGS